MASNSFGNIFRYTTFGESHGPEIGCVIDGVPPGIKLTPEDIQHDLNKRKPGSSKFVTQRKEKDIVRISSGVFEGKTTGTPIALLIKNEDQKTKDYQDIKDIYRPSHADYTYDKKFGERDYRGGGRSSARETANWVVAGALAKQLIAEISINAFTSSVGDIFLDKPYQELDFSKTEDNIIRCPDDVSAQKMIEKVKEIRKAGDTIGGTITCVAQNIPVGLGEPIFHKLHAELGKAMLSIKACQLASIIFSDTPTVPHFVFSSPDSISTRVLARVPFFSSRMRTL